MPGYKMCSCTHIHNTSVLIFKCTHISQPYLHCFHIGADQGEWCCGPCYSKPNRGYKWNSSLTQLWYCYTYERLECPTTLNDGLTRWKAGTEKDKANDDLFNEILTFFITSTTFLMLATPQKIHSYLTSNALSKKLQRMKMPFAWSVKGFWDETEKLFE